MSDSPDRRCENCKYWKELPDTRQQAMRIKGMSLVFGGCSAPLPFWRTIQTTYYTQGGEGWDCPAYIHKPTSIPVLLGTVDRIAHQIVVWCRYCQDSHIHSWQEGEVLTTVGQNVRVSLRKAHCTNEESPYLATGYYIGVSA